MAQTSTPVTSDQVMAEIILVPETAAIVDHVMHEAIHHYSFICGKPLEQKSKDIALIPAIPTLKYNFDILSGILSDTCSDILRGIAYMHQF